MRKNIFSILTILFMLLTFVGGAFVLWNNGEVNAGYAVIPSIFSITFSNLARSEKKKTDLQK